MSESFSGKIVFVTGGGRGIGLGFGAAGANLMLAARMLFYADENKAVIEAAGGVAAAARQNDLLPNKLKQQREM